MPFCTPDAVRGPPAGVLEALVYSYGRLCPPLQRIRPPTPSCRRLAQSSCSSLLSPTVDDRRRLFSLAHRRRPLEMKSAASSRSTQIGDLPRIECPRCHIKVIRTKIKKDDVYYKCPNHFTTVCCLLWFRFVLCSLLG